MLQALMGFESLGTHRSYTAEKAPERQMLDPRHHFAPNADTAILHCLVSDPLCNQSAAICARQDSQSINSTDQDACLQRKFL